MLNSLGEISVWKYTDDSFEQLVPPTRQFGQIVAIETSRHGELIAASNDGKVSVIHLAMPRTSNTQPADPAPAAPAQITQVVKVPTLTLVAEKGELGAIVGICVGKTP
jgi:hypothetical protein